MSYTHTITVPLAWDEALQQAKDALAEQGFGILSEINVRATFEAKLGAEAAASLGDYVILGACNPNLASRALAADPDMGALLPCSLARITRAACLPPCLAPSPTPGTGLPSGMVMVAVSPTTKISGCPGTVRSGSTLTRPARSGSTLSHFAAADACTPAAQMMVSASSRLLP